MTLFFKYHAKILLRGTLVLFAAAAFLILSFVSGLAVYASTVSLPLPQPLSFGTAVDAGSGSISSNWSGYVAQNQNTQYTSVAGSWIVPQVATTPSFQADATWVGIGGVSS